MSKKIFIIIFVYVEVIQCLMDLPKDLVPKSMKEEIKVIASNERKFSTWIGGSVLSTLSSFKSKWITKKDYEENGSKIIK